MDLFSNVSGKRRLKSNARLHYSSRRNSIVSPVVVSTNKQQQQSQENQEKITKKHDNNSTNEDRRNDNDSSSAQPLSSNSTNSGDQLQELLPQHPQQRTAPRQRATHYTSFLAKRAAPVLTRSYNSMPCIPNREQWANLPGNDIFFILIIIKDVLYG